MLKRMFVCLIILFLLAAPGCQTGEDESNTSSDPNIDKDVALMIGSSLIAENGELGGDIIDAFYLGNGGELESNTVDTFCIEEGEEPEPTCEPGCHCRERKRCNPFRDIVINSTWSYTGCDGELQSAYNDDTTEAVELTSEVSGTLTLPRMTKKFSREANITVAGLCGDNNDFTVNGTATSESALVFETDTSEVARYYTLNMNTELTDILIPVNSIIPLSGTITCYISMNKTSDDNFNTVIIHVEKTVVITFNGTIKPDIVIY